MEVHTLGIDVAKNVFQLHGADEHGNCQLRKRLTRKKLLPTIANVPPCLIAMEACGGTHHWAREFRKLGHEVKIINPQYVKPYVKTQKNDYNDAQAICEAVRRPTMRFVPVKSIEQQDMLALHRIRTRLVRGRTALVNQIRGLLTEYGLVLPLQVAQVRKHVPIILEDAENGLTTLFRECLVELYEELTAVDARMQTVTSRINQLCKESSACQRIARIEGIGPITATALVASVGDATEFKSGRQLAAWLGLVPRQYSSGDRTVLRGITKRGDAYIRSLLIHGARAVATRAPSKPDARSRWITELQRRCGFNKSCVAIANKNARIAWALLAKSEEYRGCVPMNA